MSKKKTLNEVELFYIKENCLTMSLSEIAEKINTDSKNIIELYEKFKKEKNLSFQKYSGTTSMTQAQSSKDDDIPKTNQNEAFFQRYKNNIHKI